MISGSPSRILDRPDHTIVGVLGESTGQRLLTIERVQDDAMVYLWDPDHLDRPIATLAWRVGPGPRGSFPLVAISPDGKTVAVVPDRGTMAKLYSARDGTPLNKRFGPGAGQPRDVWTDDNEIEPQAELLALALGPNNSLATAGNTSGGVAVRIWDLDSPSFPTSLSSPGSELHPADAVQPAGKLAGDHGKWSDRAVGSGRAQSGGLSWGCLTRRPTWRLRRMERPWPRWAARESRSSGRCTIRRCDSAQRI